MTANFPSRQRHSNRATISLVALKAVTQEPYGCAHDGGEAGSCRFVKARRDLSERAYAC